MENKAHALAAGIFVLVVTALLIALGAWLGRDTTEQRVFEISSRDAVTGLQPQAGVRYKGVLVGRVTSIGLDPAQRGNVLVRIAVNDAVPMTRTTFASLGFQGVTGLAFVQLDDPSDTSTASEALVSADGAVPRIPMRPGMVARFTEQGGNLLGQLESASARLNGLLAQDNQKQFMSAVASLGQAAAGVNQLAQQTQTLLQGSGAAGAPNLPQLAAQTEETLRVIQATTLRLADSAEAVRSSATEFRRMSARMNEPNGTLDRIARSTDALVNTTQTLNAQLVPRLNRTADETTRTVREVGRLAQGVAEQPQSLLMGRAPAAPGPGEPGFVAPLSRAVRGADLAAPAGN